MNHSFIRFLLVGVVNTIVGLSIMYGFMHIVGLSYWFSTFVGNAIGAVVSFALNRSYTFKHGGRLFHSAIRFSIVILACYFLAYYSGEHLAERLILFFDLDQLISVDNTAVLFGTVFYTVLNYIGQRRIVFPE